MAGISSALYAHLCKARKTPMRLTGYNLYISTDIQGMDVVDTYGCTGKREANEIAQRLNAQPWNF